MSTEERKKVQQQVAVVVGLLNGLDIEAAVDLMERVGRQAKIADPLVWARAKASHERMLKMMRAAMTFQRTVGAVRKEIAEVPKLILS